ncbi:MAG: GlcG/HbpS family heme-binding protein [Bradyrhizobium sp.]
MDSKGFVHLLAGFALLISTPCAAQDSLVTYKSLAPAIALELAQAAFANCQQRGYQVAVAVVDRFGVVQVILRDRFAGPHTPTTASGKAWTAATFRSSTSNLFAISQPGMMQAGIRNLPGAVVIGGGLIVESGGSLVGAIGVSGAPGGDADEACAKAGVDAIQSKLDF